MPEDHELPRRHGFGGTSFLGRRVVRHRGWTYDRGFKVKHATLGI
jgi:hypothetical protein